MTLSNQADRHTRVGDRNELTQSQIARGLIKGDEDVSEFRSLVKDGKLPAQVRAS